MKKMVRFSGIIFICLLLLMLFAGNSAFSQDTIVLKSGIKVAGKIKSMEGGIVKLEGSNGVESYEADAISSMKFCTPTNGKGNSVAMGNGASKGNSTSQTGSPCDVKEEDQPSGQVTFSCDRCGGEISLQLKGDNGKNNKTKYSFTRTLDKEQHSWKEDIPLAPGTYTWNYTDSNNNATSGKFSIRAGDKVKMVLFEK